MIDAVLGPPAAQTAEELQDERERGQEDEREREQDRKDLEAERRAYKFAAAVLVAVVLLWIATPLLIFCFISDGTARGQFGDLYGSINALFSGLAFAGVIIAILLQRRELELQRRELKLTREEMRLARREAKAAQLALNKTLYAQSFKVALDLIDSPDVVTARGVLYEYKGPLDVPDEQLEVTVRESAGRVPRTFESVGTMINKGLLPRDYILETWSVAIERSWDRLESRIFMLRKDRNDPFIGKEFESLATDAKAFLAEYAAKSRSAAAAKTGSA